MLQPKELPAHLSKQIPLVAYDNKMDNKPEHFLVEVITTQTNVNSRNGFVLLVLCPLSV